MMMDLNWWLCSGQSTKVEKKSINAKNFVPQLLLKGEIKRAGIRSGHFQKPASLNIRQIIPQSVSLAIIVGFSGTRKRANI